MTPEATSTSEPLLQAMRRAADASHCESTGPDVSCTASNAVRVWVPGRQQGAVGPRCWLGIHLDLDEVQLPVIDLVDSCLDGAELRECGVAQFAQCPNRPVWDVEREHGAAWSIGPCITVATAALPPVPSP